MATVWTPELHDAVAAAWIEGQSSRTIATRIGGETRIRLTSSMVICRMHRSGILQGSAIARSEPAEPTYVRPSRAKAAVAARRARVKAPPKPKVPVARRVAAPVRAPAPVPAKAVRKGPVPVRPGRVPLLDAVFGQCRWIAGEPSATALVCGDPVKPGKAYCPDHCRVAYVPSRSRTDTRFLDFSPPRR